ncbi:IS110 family transposase [Enterocloster clostridioformis]|uniref:IS110 family transposase n=1 Tax=Enterocloster clostridioformis TaxID=1531 RepID=UPI00080C9927|nr:IS110 family transposase [Enterocloster clostridioformis]ANU46294.1 IS110 family transposase [Lachnoclostridium sp. YL32]NDO31153.1 IS110 family transposase [Enterocloster clostridioformis]OXE65019.1 IS110 family transposase [Enterocloster clostridioformis]QQQ98978.1 IS110 family transposase [Enterocloster clostridioformis]
MKYQEVLRMPESIPYLSVGLDVGADLIWMSIMLPNGTLTGKPFKILHSDPQSRELAVTKIKEAQEMCSLESRCFLESTGIYHIPLLYFLRDKRFDCSVINPIITKNTTNMNVRKLHNDKFDSKKAAKVGLDASLKTSTYLGVFSKVTTQTSLKLLESYPLAADMLAAPKDEIVETIRSTICFGEKYALAKYDAICQAAKDVAVFGRALPSNAVRIKLYIDSCKEYQKHLDAILDTLHESVDKLRGTPVYDRICLLQSLHGVGFLSSVVLIAEMGFFDLFSSTKIYAYFGLDPAVKQSGKFKGDKAHMSKRGSSLARRILHMIALNNLKVGETTKEPVNPVIHSYYADKCKSKKKNVAVGAVMHKICNIIFAMLRDNKPFERITPQEHCERYASEHPDKVSKAA